MTVARPGLLARAGGGLGSAFWRLWGASAVSNLADGVFWVALPLLAVTLTESPALVAGVTVAWRLPWLLFTLVAGALADRLDRRRTMVAVQVARVALVVGLAGAILLDAASIALLYVVAFGLGILETIFDTTAQAILPRVVERERLGSANGRLHGVELTMNQFVGPPVGGLLAAAGFALAFGSAAAGFVGAALAIASLRGTFRAEREGQASRIHQEIGEGIRYLFGHRLLRTLAIAMGALNLGAGAVWGVFVLYAVAPGPLGLDELGYGLLLTASAIGTVLGTMVATTLARRLGKPNLFLACMATVGAQDLVLALSTNPWVIAAALAIGGIVIGTSNVTFTAFRQSIVPDRLIGRVVASSRVISWGGLPVGALLGGLIGQAFGLPAVFASAGLLAFAMLPLRLVLNDETVRAAEAGLDQGVAAGLT